MTELQPRALPVVRARSALAISVVLTLVLYHVPYAQILGWPLIWLSTFVHELGHGLTALLVGCDFELLVMNTDASGYARWSGNPGRLARAAIAAGGLLGPAVASAACFLAARSGRGARITLGVAAVFCGLVTVIWARSLFAVGFIAVLAALLGAVARWGSESTARIALSFFGVQLAMSVFSRGDYLFTPVARTAQGDMPSDVAHVAQALFLPYWFWGGLIGLASVAAVGAGLWLSLRDE